MWEMRAYIFETLANSKKGGGVSRVCFSLSFLPPVPPPLLAIMHIDREQSLGRQNNNNKKKKNMSRKCLNWFTLLFPTLEPVIPACISSSSSSSSSPPSPRFFLTMSTRDSTRILPRGQSIRVRVRVEGRRGEEGHCAEGHVGEICWLLLLLLLRCVIVVVVVIGLGLRLRVGIVGGWVCGGVVGRVEG